MTPLQYVAWLEGLIEGIGQQPITKQHAAAILERARSMQTEPVIPPLVPNWPYPPAAPISPVAPWVSPFTCATGRLDVPTVVMSMSNPSGVGFHTSLAPSPFYNASVNCAPADSVPLTPYEA
jgi:hypothetical protein